LLLFLRLCLELSFHRCQYFLPFSSLFEIQTSETFQQKFPSLLKRIDRKGHVAACEGTAAQIFEKLSYLLRLQGFVTLGAHYFEKLIEFYLSTAISIN